MSKIQIADVCFEGPSERIINSTKITLKDKLKIEFDMSEKKTVEGLLEIILDNPYCTLKEIEEIRLDGQTLKKEKKMIIEKINSLEKNNNTLEIKLNEECLGYYKGCVFYKIVEGYPEDYFLDLELEKW